MPILHIIAVGPQASGKSTLVRNFANNPPEGFKLKHMNAMDAAPHHEYWTLIFEKDKRRAKPSKPSK